MRMLAVRSWIVTAVLVAGLAAAGPAHAQYRPAPKGAVGEDFHVEVGYGWWNPTPSLIVSSEALGILGSDVDLVQDLGVIKKRVGQLDITLKPAAKHKFRIQYLPIKYEADTTVKREFVFNGQRYRVGIPVQTTATFKTSRFGYEYDFVRTIRGFAGALVDLKYTDVRVELNSPVTGLEYTSVVAPVPTVGFVGRGYVAPNVAIGGELSFFRVPESLKDQIDGKYTDFNFYGLVNFNKNFGANLGYRSINVFYQQDNDAGTLQFKGWYFSGIARF